MKNRILIFILFTLLSCNVNKTSDDLKLELLNQKIFCSSDQYDKNKESQSDNGNGKTTILYKITNNSKKKYLIVVNEDKLETYSVETLNSDTFVKKARMCFVIESSDKTEVENYTLSSESFKQVGNNNCMSTNFQIIEMEELKYKLKELDYPDIIDFQFSNAIKSNSFVLHPKESKYFKTVLNLPVYDNQIRAYKFLSYYKFDLKKNYSFKLEYVSDSKFVNSKLPEYKKNELQENHTEVFDGVVVSNKIPIVFK